MSSARPRAHSQRREPSGRKLTVRSPAASRCRADVAAVSWPPGVDIMKVDDLTDLMVAREVADGVDAVIHCASVFKRVSDMEEE